VAEKAMKALLMEREGRQPPRTHDLVALARHAALPERFVDDLASLGRAYVVSRYPDILAEPGAVTGIGPGDAEGHLRCAEEVMEWVDQQLSTAS
jgi:HEPN domain-containing protein